MKPFWQDFQVVEFNDADLQLPFRGVKFVTLCDKVEKVVKDLTQKPWGMTMYPI